ncbi:hypothetical protein N9W09_03895 [Crocinitomicaceae bacterium]|jgi:hypothetical protein|nr:hypothetical protein [Crocinitomicaceae bacterium]
MRLFFFFSFLILFVSCGTEVTDKSIKNQSKPMVADIPMALFSGEMSFNDEFVTVKTFSNGDPILHAQSKSRWAEAAENGTPAWCYIDSINKHGVLYNGYCITDGRQLLDGLRFMNEIDASIFISDFDAPKVTESSIYLMERSYMGNFNTLGFENIWIKGSEVKAGMNYVLSYSPSRALVQLRKAHLGNGYFIRTLKTN